MSSMMMNKPEVDSCFVKYLSTIHEISYDKTNNIYMSESERVVVNFDDVTLDYCNKYNPVLVHIKSCDGLFSKNEKLVFLEFKNGSLRSSKDIKGIRQKAIDSPDTYSKITDIELNLVISNSSFILVYNDAKNPESLMKITDKFAELAKTEHIRFNLENLKSIYKDVHTYTKEQFERYLL